MKRQSTIFQMFYKSMATVNHFHFISLNMAQVEPLISQTAGQLLNFLYKKKKTKKKQSSEFSGFSNLGPRFQGNGQTGAIN